CTERSNAPEAPTWPELDSAWIELYAETGRFRRGQVRSPAFTPDGAQVLFLQSAATEREQSLHRVELDTGRVEQFLEVKDLLGEEALQESDEELARRERQRVKSSGIVSFEISPDSQFILVPVSGRVFRASLADGTHEELNLSGEGAALDPRLSPDGKYLAYVRERSLWVYDFAGRRSRRLVSPRSDAESIGCAEFVAQEEMDRDHGYWWAPDSRSLAYQKTDESDVATLYRTSLSSPTKAPVSQRYPRPGEANATVDLFTVSVWGGASTEIKWDREAYPYVTQVRWSQNAPLTVAVQDRGQNNIVLMEVDERGNTRELHREADPHWVAIDSAVPLWLPDGSAFLWSSERDGDWQLELRTAAGELSRVLVPSKVGYRALAGMSVD
ncbi:MAG: DPP IV N-terminal domain-containing protein, partial [Myxococcota bacterium]